MDTEKSYLEDELELEVPKNGLKTMKRMWDSAPEQHLRLLLVMISVVCYTLFSIEMCIRDSCYTTAAYLSMRTVR